MNTAALLVCALLGATTTHVSGHGFLATPAARNVVYEKGPRFPSSSDLGGAGDIQNLNAGIGGGGVGMALEQSQGHGLCGDDATLQRFNGAGPYGASPATMTATYSQGAWIDVDVKVTAYHYGWFEFRLCDFDDSASFSDPVTQECLNMHVLKFDVNDAQQRYGGKMHSGIASPSDYKSLSKHVRCGGIPGAPKGSCCNGGGACSDPSQNNDRFVLPKATPDNRYQLRLKLPAGVTCKRCTMQWMYQTGNSPYSYPEAFWNCADFAITADGTGETSPSTDPPTSTEEEVTVSPTAAATEVPATGGEQTTCKAAGAWAGDANMDNWCVLNCPSNCPATHCTCTTSESTDAPTEETTASPTAQVTSSPTAAATSTKSPTVATTASPTVAATEVETEAPAGGGETTSCKAAGAWAGNANMDNWCVLNCPSNCPATHCICTSSGTTAPSQETGAPATDAPATDAPATDAPMTNPPTDAPATNAPGTTSPTTTPQHPDSGSHGNTRVCYYTNWAQYRTGAGKFLPEDIDASLCSHINFGFGKINAAFELEPVEWNDLDTDWSDGIYTRVNAMKASNPSLKTLLSLGGWNFNDCNGAGSTTCRYFHDMCLTKNSRSVFIRSAISYLRANNFDGLDLDWEYPAVAGHNKAGTPTPEDKANFVLLLREAKIAFADEAQSSNKDMLLLTAAVGVGKSTVEQAYDIVGMAEQLDFINLMTYDMHGGWDGMTGHQAPLVETGTNAYDYPLSVTWVLDYWVANGCPPEKLILGIGTYGRSFTLTSSDTGFNAPATTGNAGPLTREKGFLAYHEIAADLAAGRLTRVWDEGRKVPYAYSTETQQWVGYDDAESIKHKINQVKARGLGGAMIWALDLDVFANKAYPLLRAINTELGVTTRRRALRGSR